MFGFMPMPIPIPAPVVGGGGLSSSEWVWLIYIVGAVIWGLLWLTHWWVYRDGEVEQHQRRDAIMSLLVPVWPIPFSAYVVIGIIHLARDAFSKEVK